ncbi:MAG: CarD family transcriptional regulator [Eubacteriales bacterium]|nr:CarD family transcriptional regulator [Eubacteriales bacterium]
MFKVGDKVAYPMHGAGIIEGIEEKEILGEKKKYYVMRLPGDMKVMIPTSKVKESGLRKVIDEEGVKRVLAILSSKKDDDNTNWNHRYRNHLEKMRSGDIYEVAEVFRNLCYRQKEKGLSTGERKMLENARQILVSELVLAKDMEEEKVLTLIEKAMA